MKDERLTQLHVTLQRGYIAGGSSVAEAVVAADVAIAEIASLTRELEEAKAAVLPFIEYLQHDQLVEPDGAQEIWLDDSALPKLAALYALGARLSRAQPGQDDRQEKA